MVSLLGAPGNVIIDQDPVKLMSRGHLVAAEGGIILVGDMELKSCC